MSQINPIQVNHFTNHHPSAFMNKICPILPIKLTTVYTSPIKSFWKCLREEVRTFGWKTMKSKMKRRRNLVFVRIFIFFWIQRFVTAIVIWLKLTGVMLKGEIFFDCFEKNWALASWNRIFGESFAYYATQKNWHFYTPPP